MLGCTKGAIRAWNFAVSPLLKTNMRLLRRTGGNELRLNTPGVGQVGHQALAGRGLHRLDADGRASCESRRPLLHSLATGW